MESLIFGHDQSMTRVHHMECTAFETNKLDLRKGKERVLVLVFIIDEITNTSALCIIFVEMCVRHFHFKASIFRYFWY